MLFNSFSFLIFFPVVLGIYFVIPKKVKQLWLLIASYYFYMNWNAIYAILILGITVIGYVSGILLERADARVTSDQAAVQRKRKFYMCAAAVLSLGILFTFKYLNFAIENINRLFQMTGSSFAVAAVDIVLPVGISFYTFQALGYVIDVYRRDVAVERNFLRYALFVSFFPQLVAGPIERSRNLLRQLKGPAKFDYDAAKNGLLLMLWGYFEKMWVADRLAVLVDKVYNDYGNYSAGMIVFATMLFSIQIYCDFGGYSHIAIGAAQVLGIRLMDNFRQPYLATNIKEFWNRWHISLSTWFRDYVYFPLGGSRCSKPKEYRNLMITFLVSGLWHGASWHFVVWGGLNGFYQIVGRTMKQAREKLHAALHICEDGIPLRIIQTVVTFLLASFAWLFFRADSLGNAYGMIHRILTNGVWLQQFKDGSIFMMGLSRLAIYQLWGSLAVLFAVDICHERGVSFRRWIAARPIVVRWGIYMITLLAFLVLVIQNFGRPAAEFIYFQF